MKLIEHIKKTDFSKTLSIFANPRDAVAFGLFLLGWLVILAGSGAIVSGYHLTDDHEIIRIHTDLASGGGFFPVAQKWIVSDFEIRFRPFYYFYRVLETQVFGTNILAWSIHNLVLAILTSGIFFSVFRRLKFPFWGSMFAVSLIFLGEQACIWWRLGPNETIGAFLLSITLFLLTLRARKDEYAGWYHLLYLVFAVAMSLSKESFVLFIPALVFFQVFLSTEFGTASWIRSVRKNMWDELFLFAVMIAELCFIVLHVGTTKIGYAGVDEVDALGYFKTLLILSANNWVGPLVLFMTLSLGYILFKTNANTSDRKRAAINWFRESFPYVVLAFLILLPQIILYAKSGIVARYAIPGVLGFVFPFLFLFKNIKEADAGFSSVKTLVYVAVFAAIGFGSYKSFYGSYEFAHEGKEIGRIFTILESRKALGEPYLIVSDPYMYMEWFGSFGQYATHELHIDNAYIYPVSKRKSGSAVTSPGDFTQSAYNNRTYVDLDDKQSIGTVVIFPSLEKTFMSDFEFAESIRRGEYAREDIHDFIVLSKKQ